MTFIPSPVETVAQPVIPSPIPPAAVLPEEDAVDLATQAANATAFLGGDYDEALSIYSRQIKEGNSDAARRVITNADFNKKQDAETQVIKDALSDPESDAIDNLALIQQSQDIQQSPTALEQNAIDGLSATEVAIREVEQEGEFQRYLGRNKKQLIMENKLKQLHVAAEADTGLFDTPIPILIAETAKFLTLADTFSKVFGLSTLAFGSGVRDLMADIGPAHPDQLPDILAKHQRTIEAMQFGADPTVTEEMFSYIDMTEESENFHILLNVLDIAIVASLLKPVVTASHRMFKSSSFGTASKEMAPERVAASIVKGGDDLAGPPNTAIENILPLQVEAKIAEGSAQSPALSNAVQGAREEVAGELKQLGNNLTAPVDPSLVSLPNEAVNAIARETTVTLSTKQIGNVTLGEPGALSTILLRSTAGKEYATEKGANALGERLGVPYTVVSTPAEKFVVQIESGLDDAAYPLVFEKMQPTMNITTQVGSIDHWIDPLLLSMARQSEGSVSRITQVMEKVLKKNVAKMGQKQRRDVARVMQEGRAQKKWFTPTEFTQEYKRLTAGRIPSEKEHIAYNTLKQVSDFSWGLSNRVRFDDATRRGMKSIHLSDYKDLGFVNGNIVPKTEEILTKNHVYSSVAETLFKRNADEAADIINSSQILVKLGGESIEQVAKRTGHHSEYILVNAGKATENALSYKQLGYVGGGSVHYKAGGFIKQANLVRFGDGSVMRLRDKTLYGATSLRQAKEFADGANTGMRVITKLEEGGITPQQADVLMQELGFDSVEAFTKRLDDIGVDRTLSITALGDREFVEVAEEVISDFSRLPSRARGEKTVPHVAGGEVEMLDVSSSVAKGVDNASQEYSFATFRETLPQALMQKFGKFLELDKNATAMSSLTAKINEGAIKGNERLRNAILGHQRWANSVLRVPTAAEKSWVEMVDRRVDQLFNSDISGLMANRAVDWMGRKSVAQNQMKVTEAIAQDPVAKFKGFAFDAALGLFNPATFILQASQMPIIAAVGGRAGLKSLREAPWIAGVLAMDDKGVNALVQKASKTMDFDDLGDFNLYIQELRNTGMTHYGNNLSYLDGVAGTQGYNALYAHAGESGKVMTAVGDAAKSVGNAASTLRRAGRIGFTQGDLMPRITAFSTAVRKWRGNQGGINPKNLGIDSTAGRKWIRDEADRLVLGVSGVDIQLGFKGRGGWAGIFSMATQFYSYPFRMIAAMTPGMNRSFTNAEKLRMTMAYVGLYGSAGTVATAALSGFIFDEQVGSLRGVDKALGLTPGSAYKTLESGIIDGLLFASSEGEKDTAFGHRAGPGSFATDIFQSADRFDMHSPTTWGAMFGAGPRSMTNFFDAMSKTAETYAVFSEPSVTGVKEMVLAGLASSIGSFSVGYRAYLAAQTQKLYDRSGTPITDINAGEIALMLVGIPPSAYHDSSIMFDGANAFKSVVKDGAEHFRKLELEFDIAVRNGDEERQKYILERIHLVGLALQDQPEVWDAVVQRVNGELGRGTRLESLYHAAYERSILAGGDSNTVDENLIDKLMQKQIRIDDGE